VLMGKYTKYVTEMYSDDMGWIKEAQDRDKWRAVVSILRTFCWVT
jgi:hypothetical protein